MNTALRKLTIAAVALSALALAMPAASASTNYSTLCQNSGVGYCLKDANGGGNGSPIIMRPRVVTDPNEGLALPLNNIAGCGDHVKPSGSGDCPFNTTANNNQFAGDPIVWIAFIAHNGACVTNSNNAGQTYEPCTNRGTAWVQDGNFLVNVYGSGLGVQIPVYLYGGGDGTQATVTANPDNTSAYWGLNPA
jgi:hypothetical protein